MQGVDQARKHVFCVSYNNYNGHIRTNQKLGNAANFFAF